MSAPARSRCRRPPRPTPRRLALGVAVAVGGTVGASISEATASPTVLAQIDSAVDAAHATRITSGSLSVTATGTYNGTTPATDIPKTASTPSSTDDFQVGGSNAAAWSVAGTGAYFLAVQGTVAIANDNASVTAHIGNFTVLPTGNVAVNAANTTVLVALGNGIAVSNGGFSLGAVVVRADADTKTSATLGNSVKIGTAATRRERPDRRRDRNRLQHGALDRRRRRPLFRLGRHRHYRSDLDSDRRDRRQRHTVYYVSDADRRAHRLLQIHRRLGHRPPSSAPAARRRRTMPTRR